MRRAGIKILKTFLGLIFISILAILLAFASVFAHLYRTTPAAGDLSQYLRAENIGIYDRTGTRLLYEMRGKDNRVVLSHDEIPDIARIAVIAAEDTYFYEHRGFNPGSMLRALRANIEHNKIVQGGSTITQQLARNVFLSNERTIERKLKEIAMAIKMEKVFSKEEILDIYMNEIPSISNARGIQAASQSLFEKDAKDLTLDEAAIIAALIKAPNYYSPFGENKEELLARQRYILEKIKSSGQVEESKIEVALREKTIRKIKPQKVKIEAPHFVFYVIEQLEQSQGKDAVERGGFKVVTTLDYDLQKEAEEIVRTGAEGNEKKFGAENAALVALDPKTGEVLSMVGSRNYFDTTIDGKVNVTLRPRQPGSAFKPIVYAKAFEKGYQPETVLYDVKIDFGPDGSGRNYVPRNFDGKFRGMVTMRQALAMSLNVPSVQTLYLAGVKDSIRLAQQLGVTTLKDINRYGLSLVLGGGDVKLLELSSAYSVFANEGRMAPAHGIQRIEWREGRVYTYPSSQTTKVIDSETARKISSILTDKSARAPVFGRASTLEIKDREVAVKTGTTQDFRDGWTLGYTPSLVVGVWTGNNDNSPMRRGEPGVSVAAPIWQKFMQKAVARYPRESFIAYQKVNSDNFLVTGKLEKSRIFSVSDDEENDKDNDKKDKSKKKRKSDSHSILFYVNKDAPLGNAVPDFNDPMLARWEKAVAKEKSVSKSDDKNDKKDKKDKNKNKKD